jgi:MFS family permease
MSFRQSNLLWRNRNFLLLVSGQGISTLGSSISQIAYPLLTLALTGSSAQAGLVAALGTLPFLLFSLPAGAFMDRWNRKQVMILADIGRSLCLISISIALALGHLSIVQLYITSTLQGTFYVFFDIAEVASLPRMVSKEQLSTAMATNNAVITSFSILGPPLGGFLFQISRGFPFLADAVSYLASSCSLLFIKTAFQEERAVTQKTLYQEIVAGLLWLWRQPLIRFLTFFGAIYVFVVFSGGELVVIILAQRHLHASAAFIGVIFTMAELGRIVGTLLVPKIAKYTRIGNIVVAIGVLTSMLLLLLTLTPNIWFLGCVLAAQYLISAVYDAVVFGYELGLIPDEFQGRVNSVMRLIVFTTQSLGVAATGFLLQWIGITPTIILFAVAIALFTIVAAFNRHVRSASSTAVSESEV